MSDRVEELGDLLDERRAARDRRPDAAAEPRLDLRVDEPVGDAGAGAERAPTGSCPSSWRACRPRGRRASAQSASRRFAPVVSSIARDDGRVDLLVDARHAREHGRTHVRQRLGGLQRVGRKAIV